MRTRTILAAATLLAAGALLGWPVQLATPAQPAKDSIPFAKCRAIAKEAYIYGFLLVDNYRILYAYFVDRDNREYKGPWNKVSSVARVFTPEDKAVQSPNSDTPYSAVGADLRAEPLVFTVPAVEKGRYYSVQFIDLYTVQFRLRRQPRHRQRCGELPARRAELEGREARRRQGGDPVRDGIRAGALPHATI
jgi:hypothetical protein